MAYFAGEKMGWWPTCPFLFLLIVALTCNLLFVLRS